ncbi:HAD family hydrolase [Bacillus sp. FJAT-44742]|uniref:HAD family hydrolase n=1 Tax=Bacillus sp. FJAT-44742 TaxID=2014005 RepID=UPI000C23FCB1|nr:HAD family hydrolase [Bacillus sp. FJAT-44742]
MIKGVIFDLDDTLLWDKKSVQEAFRETCKEAQKEKGIDPLLLEEKVREEASALYCSYETFPFTKMIGINPFEGLWGDFTDKTDIGFRKMSKMAPDYRKEAWTRGLKQAGVDDPVFGAYLAERFPYHRRQLPFVYDDTFELLAELQKNYRMLLLTNGSPTLQNEKLEMTPELVPYFDYILVSGAYGRGKPDASIFEHSLSLLNLTKDEAVMIGDNLNTDIKGSNKINMKNIWINRENKEPQPDIPFTEEVKSLKEIPEILKKWNEN